MGSCQLRSSSICIVLTDSTSSMLGRDGVFELVGNSFESPWTLSSSSLFEDGKPSVMACSKKVPSRGENQVAGAVWRKYREKRVERAAAIVLPSARKREGESLVYGECDGGGGGGGSDGDRDDSGNGDSGCYGGAGSGGDGDWWWWWLCWGVAVVVAVTTITMVVVATAMVIVMIR
ncbi:unnamed protein product [Prunus armeniaca]